MTAITHPAGCAACDRIDGLNVSIAAFVVGVDSTITELIEEILTGVHTTTNTINNVYFEEEIHTFITATCQACGATFRTSKAAQRHAAGRGHVVRIDYPEPTERTT